MFTFDARSRVLRILLALVSLSLLATACGGGNADAGDPQAAQDQAEDDAAGDAGDDAADEGEGDAEGDAGGGLSGNLTGAGATFPEPLYLEWIGEYTQNVETGVSVNYQGVGSSGGKEQLIAQQVDFAGSDSVMNDEELQAASDARDGAEVLHIPMVFGAVVVAYNIPDVEGLVLDGETIANIFLGTITNLNDPAIAALNEGVELPDQDLNVVHRSDGSGTTSIFTKYLEDVSGEWADQVGSGSEVEWPTGVGGNGNDGVAAAIQQQPGGIGYVNLEFAVESGLPFADVENSDGNAVTPSTESVTEAAGEIDPPEDLRFDVLGVGGEGYPIAGATWILAYTGGYDEESATALQEWLRWNLEEGDDLASELNYAPISDSLQERALEMVDRINEDG